MAGTHEGRVIIFPQLTEQLTPFEDKPQAKKLIDADGGNLILMELAAGQSCMSTTACTRWLCRP